MRIKVDYRRGAEEAVGGGQQKVRVLGGNTLAAPAQPLPLPWLRPPLLAVPPQLDFAVVKTRLITQGPAAGGEPRRLTTVIAPAGYGKTVLLAQWYEQALARGEQACWITPAQQGAPLDNLIEALETALQADAVQVSSSRECRHLAQRVERLCMLLRNRRAALSLFIDGFEPCCGPEASALLQLLLAQSASVRWVVASRYELAIDCVAARLDETLRELGAQDLAFDPAEIRALLGEALCAGLDEQQLLDIAELSEGWPAVLRLLMRRLGEGQCPSTVLEQFAAGDEALAQLMGQKVLAPLSEAQHALLMELSLLPRLSGNLSAAIGLRSGALQSLVHLRALGCPIMSLDAGGQQYRFHRLFQGFLQRQSESVLEPARRRAILQTAAGWFEAQRQWREAIRAYVEAEQLGRAAQLLERCAERLVRDRGDLKTVTDWVDFFRDKGLSVGPLTEFWYLWALSFRRRHGLSIHQSRAIEERLRAACRSEGASGEIQELCRSLPIIRACSEMFSDHHRLAVASAQQWLLHNPDGDPFHNATAAAIQSLALANDGCLAEARASIRAAHAAVMQTSSCYGSAWICMIDAYIKIRMGECRDARDDVRAMLTTLEPEIGLDAPIASTLALIGAKASLDLGLDCEARQLLALGMRNAHGHGLLDLVACGLEVGVRLSMGTPEEAARARVLDRIASAYPERLSLMLSCYRIRALLSLNRIEEAIQEADRVVLDHTRAPTPGATYSQAYRALHAGTQLQLRVAQCAFGKALPLFEEELRAARSELRSGDLVELLLQMTSLSLMRNDREGARRYFLKALPVAANCGLIRPFRDQAVALGGLISESRPRDWTFTREEDRRFFMAVCRELPISQDWLKEEIGTPEGLSEPLIQREIELLRLIETGQSNHQLAARLDLSVPTVKWHLYNLYRKLGARSRSAALARARVLNLLR
ncbi:ATP-, maltotriose-and DNA-dependent transcriptional regulator MalT [Solimonas aquatica]|uniref:ATP-, maltotriose-and DNA-dependent transcriptional regulator MalT n=1 Tax=Solimonas aquatica TaxID=489703 RepID=A0A1H9GCW0_9GAMM|nr:LuxR C-terminal-related transcriptional regulator [Solimonas aquatica]SEQ47917.1 ATP-, maltotriose-and DNA-dependent transcriptional regulator MalT [Solimonas aquatica]